MLDQVKSRAVLAEVARAIGDGMENLAALQGDVRQLKASVQKIQPRSATAISVVGSDGGNNEISYDPFSIQLVRVVDSANNDYFIEAVTPNMPMSMIEEKHFDSGGAPKSSLGRMLNRMGLNSLGQLGPVFANEENRSPSWIQEYRGALEWASLYELICERNYGSDTLIIRDGPLREKMFGQNFGKLREILAEAIDEQFRKSRRRVYLAGVIKHSKVMQKYRLALALEGVLRTFYPCYAEIPKAMLTQSFKWKEWIENSDSKEQFVAGRMFFAKFGRSPWDPVWIVDIFEHQAGEASKILGFMLNDALGGFPIPFYPRCLQTAHDAAALVGFDQDILQRSIEESLRQALRAKGPVIDKLALQEADVAQKRY